MLNCCRRVLVSRGWRYAGCFLLLVGTIALVWRWNDIVEKRVAVVVPSQVFRGAWQRPLPLRRLIEREHVRTVISLTAINEDDPKYVDQSRVVLEMGVRWIIVPMRGSTATLEQLAEAADLIADRSLQPVFFHCVAGHHRSNLAQAAYRIRHEGWSSEQSWTELTALDWTRPQAESDREDKRLIERFAASPYARFRPGRDATHEIRTATEVGAARDPGRLDDGLGGRGMELRHRELRDRDPGPGLSLGAVAVGRSGTKSR
jgi:protein tyrosine phosphatase (PTP) superfamily phosphohydrolase (DUF442 family)